MTIEELKNMVVPFDVVCSLSCGNKSTVIGFSQNDPLGVGGGLLPDIPVAYFAGGGWILVANLLLYYDLCSETKNE